MQSSKPNYGIDAWPVVRNILLIGVALIILGLFVPKIILGDFSVDLHKTAIITGPLLIAQALLMIAYAKKGKFQHRDRMLNMVNWKGNEKVLDVGTGRGLLMIGAAKKLTTGTSIGIDIWNQEDLSGNTVENALQNASLENVSNKIEIKNENARQMNFPDQSFDVVMSNLCLHNIYSKEGRKEGCTEISRVLKPDGIAIISDFRHTGEYEKNFKALGWETELSAPYLFSTFPPLRILKVTKK